MKKRKRLFSLFLAVVLLTKVYMGIYREKRRKEEEAKKDA